MPAAKKKTRKPGPAVAAEQTVATVRERRIVWLSWCVLLLMFAGLAVRCIQVQYVRDADYAAACVRQQRSFLPLSPQRGAILDTRGRVLAASNSMGIIFVEPRSVLEAKELSTELAEILNLPAHEVCKTITESRNPGFVQILADVEPHLCDQVARLPAVGVQRGWRRHYPMGRLACHVVGFTSIDNQGLDGIEFAFNADLSGSGARDTFLVDVHRRPICLDPLRAQDDGVLYDGLGVILTLDATIQQFARAALAERCRDYEAEAGVAIVAEPDTGAILAMVSLPDYDPQAFRTADPNTFRNRGLVDQYEPGSVIKPIVAAIALDSGVVSRYEKIFCENGDYRGKGFGRIGEYRQGFGDLTVKEILVKSSNIGMAKIGQRLGQRRLYEGLRLFGFGKKVDLGLPGEAEGLLRPTEQWTGYSVTRIPFGQEISVTAIQMVRAFCIIANGGRIVRPHLVKAVVDPNGTMHDRRPSAPPVAYIVKPEVAKWVVNEALTAVVNEPTGTGRRAKLERWQVFGKTGTAQLAYPEGGGYEDGAYVASFVAGAPAGNPRVLALVSIRKPNRRLGKGYTGGVVAGPVAATILEKTLTYLEGPRPTDDTRRMARSGR